MKRIAYCLAAVFFSAFLPGVAAESLEGYQVMALSPIDERAVVKTPEHKMSVLKPGDAIEGTGATVTQVLTDKLVLEQTVTAENGAKLIETIWFYKSSGGTSRVKRLRRQPPAGEGGRSVNENTGSSSIQ